MASAAVPSYSARSAGSAASGSGCAHANDTVRTSGASRSLQRSGEPAMTQVRARVAFSRVAAETESLLLPYWCCHSPAAKANVLILAFKLLGRNTPLQLISAVVKLVQLCDVGRAGLLGVHAALQEISQDPVLRQYNLRHNGFCT